MFGFQLLDLTENRLIQAIQSEQDDEHEEEPTSTVLTRRGQALENINEQRAKWKKRFDEKHEEPKTYQVDDLVVLENEPPATGTSRKLEPKYRGPYRIAKVLGRDRYLIQDVDGAPVSNRKVPSVYSSDKMKPWCRYPPDMDNDDNEPSEEDDDD